MFRFAASALLYSFSAYNFFKLGLDFLAGLQRCKMYTSFELPFAFLRATECHCKSFENVLSSLQKRPYRILHFSRKGAFYEQDPMLVPC